MKYKKWSLEEKLEILACAKETGVVETCRKYSVSTGTFYSWKKKFEHKGEDGLKINYDARNKKVKQMEEENRLLGKLLENKKIELEVQQELLKKEGWDIRSKIDLVDTICKKHGCSRTWVITLVGMAQSSYYRKPGDGRRGRKKPSELTYHESRGWVGQSMVVEAVKKLREHESTNRGYRLMTSYLQRDGFIINHKKLYRIMKTEGLL